eukprot:m.13763 g.13763  ORF g.13763 m.13763 type:complete len:414 (+) comp4921_c0_seq1:287-1528(+)
MAAVREGGGGGGGGALGAASGPAKSNIRFLTFNQDASRLAVGTTTGSQTYSCDPMGLVHNKGGEGSSIVEMLFSSHLVAHVGAGEGAASSQRCLRMINANTENLILQLCYRSAILAVKLNRERLVAVLETSIYIHDISNMHTLHTIDPTPRNDKGICALSCHPEGSEHPGVNSFLAFPASDTTGEVYVFDVVNLKMVTPIEAHTSPIAALAFNPSGSKLATASTKGTVIRVFDPSKRVKLFELRRGLQTSAQIFSMAFNDTGSLLCVSSDKSTVHVFKLDAEPETQPQDGNSQSMLSYISSTLSTAASSAAVLLPTQVTEIWSGQRNFAQATLPSNCVGQQNVCALRWSKVAPTPHWEVLVATFDGYFFKFALSEEGGECQLDKTHPLETDVVCKKPTNSGSKSPVPSEPHEP